LYRYTEQLNVLSRAKRSARAVEVDKDAMDDLKNPNAAHLYVGLVQQLN
jgi:hypothetical protein